MAMPRVKKEKKQRGAREHKPHRQWKQPNELGTYVHRNGNQIKLISGSPSYWEITLKDGRVFESREPLRDLMERFSQHVEE